MVETIEFLLLECPAVALLSYSAIIVLFGWLRLHHGKEQPQKSQLCYITKVHLSCKVHWKSEQRSRASYLHGPG